MRASPDATGVRREDFFVRRPHLVVVPLSTLPNWEREFRAWAPQLNIVSFAGNAASRAVIKNREFYAPVQAGAKLYAPPPSLPPTLPL
jgi:hypothetical protein